MEAYAQGLGHADLAKRLNIPQAKSLAVGGSANSRILRTTLKHSYQQSQPTFYVLGMTFLSRLEIPILESKNDFEGRWTNPQNQQYAGLWQYGWTQQDTNAFVDIKLKTEIHSILDRTEDLMYRILSTIADLQSRGHQVLVYQQADPLYQEFLSDPRLQYFQNVANIIDGYAWRAVPWQLSQGVPPINYGNQPIHLVPDDLKHPAPGHHRVLNEFLANYINNHHLI
jgi:hypothetical protein